MPSPGPEGSFFQAPTEKKRWRKRTPTTNKRGYGVRPQKNPPKPRARTKNVTPTSFFPLRDATGRVDSALCVRKKPAPRPLNFIQQKCAPPAYLLFTASRGLVRHASISVANPRECCTTVRRSHRLHENKSSRAEHTTLLSPHVDGWRCQSVCTRTTVSWKRSRVSKTHLCRIVLLCVSCIRPTISRAKNSTSKSALFHCQYRKGLNTLKLSEG